VESPFPNWGRGPRSRPKWDAAAYGGCVATVRAMQQPNHDEEEPDRGAPSTGFQRIGSAPSPDVTALLAQVDRLRAVPGVAVSARFDTISDGVRTLATLEGTLAADAFDTLTEVTCRNDTGAMAVAYTAALAALSDARHSASSTVQHALLAELRAEYARAADRNYAAVADAFDGLARSLTAAASIVDLRTAAIDVLHGTEDERAAWLTAEQVGRRLDEHAALLTAAAKAAGKHLVHESHRLGVETEQWLQLTVDASGQDRCRAWEAWDAPAGNAADRWGGMLLAGFSVRATPLADIRPYGRPLPSDGDLRPDESGLPQRDLDHGADRVPAPPPRAGQAAEAGHRISWQRAVGLLGLGCVALGVGLGCVVFALGFTVAAVLEPHDVLLAAREALCGDLLLGAGLSAGLVWAIVAAIGYHAGADSALPRRRWTLLHPYEGAPLVVHGWADRAAVLAALAVRNRRVPADPPVGSPAEPGWEWVSDAYEGRSTPDPERRARRGVPVAMQAADLLGTAPELFGR
jgi:hypothetical protein